MPDRCRLRRDRPRLLAAALSDCPLGSGQCGTSAWPTSIPSLLALSSSTRIVTVPSPSLPPSLPPPGQGVTSQETGIPNMKMCCSYCIYLAENLCDNPPPISSVAEDTTRRLSQVFRLTIFNPIHALNPIDIRVTNTLDPINPSTLASIRTRQESPNS